MEKKKAYALIGVILIIILFIFKENKEANDLNENKKATIGKIIKLRGKYQARYALVYEYFVNEKRYTASVGISPFTCANGKKNCLGEKFTVYYSSKNPENSKIDLGKYEKYKTTIE